MLQIGVFTSVSVAALALLQFAVWYFRPHRGRLRQRLNEEFGGETADATPLYRDMEAFELGAKEGDAGDADAAAAEAPPSPDWRKRLELLILQSGATATVGQLIAVSQVCGIAFGLIAFWLTTWYVGVLAGLAGAGLPLYLLRWKRRARQEKLLKQLPGTFELMSRVIRSGQSVPQAFQAASASADAPLAGECARCQHQLDLGLRPEVALRELGQRTGVLELRLFVVAMAIQRQTGGNLSDVLERLAALVRVRLRLRQQVRALTAEGRLQSTTLIVLPFLTFAAMYFMNRQYAQTLFEHVRMLQATAALMIVGVWWIRKIVNHDT